MRKHWQREMMVLTIHHWRMQTSTASWFWGNYHEAVDAWRTWSLCLLHLLLVPQFCPKTCNLGIIGRNSQRYWTFLETVSAQTHAQRSASSKNGALYRHIGLIMSGIGPKWPVKNKMGHWWVELFQYYDQTLFFFFLMNWNRRSSSSSSPYLIFSSGSDQWLVFIMTTL